MTAPTYFTVVGDFKSIVADTVGDTDADPDSVSLLATVTFTPRINDGDLILATNASPRPTAFVAAPISGTVGSDGILKLRDAGSSGFPGLSYTPVRLLADTPLLELDGDLFYDVTFSNVSYNGRFITLNGFTFQAPTSDVTLNLVTVARAPGQPATAITKIAPTGVRFTGGNMVFSFSGVDIPEPLPLSSITGPQGPQGPQGIQGQAGVSLDINGTVATYANLPSSAADGEAYVVAADGKLYYRFDGAWPAEGTGVPFVGPQGPTGPQGAMGASGIPGVSGVPGEKGATGETGATGASGASGGTGGTGLAGQSVSLKGSVATYAALPGSATNGDGYILLTDNLLYVYNSGWPAEGTGVPFVGPQGASGVPGASGASGVPGLNGASGTPGLEGASGIPGATGPTGATGASGGTGGTGGTGGVGASGASGGRVRSVSTVTSTTTLGAAANTDYYVRIGATPTEDPNIVSLLNFNGNNASTVFSDIAASPVTWTASGGAKLSTATKKFGTASLELNGSSDYISCAASSKFNPSATSFTAEIWVYPNNTTSAYRSIMSMRDSETVCPFIIYQYGQKIAWVIGNAALNLFSVNTESSANVFTASEWAHVAVVGNGSNMVLYVNGTSVLTASQPAWTSANRPMLLGADSSGINFFNGFLDDFRYHKATAFYTSNFTAPSAELTNTVPGGTTVTLPTAVSSNALYTLKNVSALSATVGTTSSETIEGATGYTLTSNSQIVLLSDGSKWNIW